MTKKEKKKRRQIPARGCKRRKNPMAQRKLAESTYRNQSTAIIMEMSLVGKPSAVRTSSIVTKPADGTDAAPIEAAVEVSETMMIWPRLNSTAFICAIKIAATAS